MLSASHLEDALSRIQTIVTLASQAEPPVTEHEALEQVVETLELAGFGAPRLDADLLRAERDLRSLDA